MAAPVCLISILLVWGAGGALLRFRYARLYGGEQRFKTLARGYLWGGPKEGRGLQRAIWTWGLFWPLLFLFLAVTVFQER